MILWNELKYKMLQHPSQVVCENNAELTYEELAIFAELLAQKLCDVQCCAVLCQSEMAAAMALLGCFAAGVTAVPLSARYGERHCDKILKAVSPNAVITDEDGKFHIRRIKDAGYTEPEIHPALIMYTSGTTGTPKGAMLSEANILTNITDISAYFAIENSDTILISRPLYHCAVLTGEFLTALLKGTKIRFYSESFNPSKLLELIYTFEITAFCGTPTLLSILTRFHRESVPCSLKHICISGECMNRETGQRVARAFPDAEIYHVYGLTEACPRVSYLPPQLFSEYPDCVGIPLHSVSLKIVRDDGKTASAGQEGMLWIRGGNVMLGYYQQPQKTSEVLKDNWLCTGDIAVINHAGLLKIKGRKDHLIIKAGMNIYPAEIESALKKDVRVSEALAYGFENDYGTQIGVKIVGDFSSAKEVKQLCQECLPAFQIPTRIDLVNELPKNGSGKIDRRVEGV